MSRDNRALAGGAGAVAAAYGIYEIAKTVLNSYAARTAYYAHQTNITTDTIQQANQLAVPSLNDLLLPGMAIFFAGACFAYIVYCRKS